MKLSSLMTRVGAAGAVVGLAIIGPAVAAGASSALPVSLPVVVAPIEGHVVSNPVIDLVPSPASPVASGADATVPAHADGSVATPVTRSGRHLAKARASVDACVAAALLSGHDLKGCGSSAGTNGAGTAPSLADSLSRVGVCVGLALDQGVSPDSCTASGSGVTIGNGSDNGSDGNSDNGSDSGSDSGSVSDVAPIDNEQVGEVVADAGLCDIVSQVGLEFDACFTNASTGSGSDGSGAAGNGTAAHPAIDLCRGLAVVAGLDLANCTVKTAAKPSGSRRSTGGHKAAVGNENTGGEQGTGAPAQLNGNCASSSARVGSSSPIGNLSPAELGTMGALAGLAMALRRLRRPRLG